MKSVKSAIGYLFAILSVAFAIATYASDGIIGKAIVKHGNLAVSPNMYGGDIIKTMYRGGKRVVIHEPVFQGLFKPEKKGFIQVDFIQDNNDPGLIREDIDFDNNNTIDFQIVYNEETSHAEVKPYHPNISNQFTAIKRKSAYTVRISLSNPDFE